VIAMQIVDSPTERTTAATDLLIALAALGGIGYLRSQPHPVPADTSAWTWAFALLAVSAALGAAYHGLALDGSRRSRLWQALTLCLALAIALVACGIAHDLLGAEAADRALPALLAVGAAVYALSRAFPGLFIVFLLYQAVVLLAALAAYGTLAVSGPGGWPAWVSAGVALALAGAAVQARRRSRIRLVWEFDHNGVFHLFQAAGLVVIWLGLGMR
jgi:heme/copper-type cytochrome/quinol oxidase subunit 3